ncbi:MAG: beta-propeller domain-containing protein [Ruminococcus sp.]|nr:beta-propeller domain-containing protein [Ruminococcus sp.]
MEEKAKQNPNAGETVKEKKRLSTTARIAAAAGFALVGLAVLVLVGTLVYNFISSNNKVVEAKVTAFKNDKQVASKIKNVIKNSGKYYSSSSNYLRPLSDNSIPLNEQSDTSAESSEQVLNNHTAYSQAAPESVDDTVKTDDKYIYFLNSGGGGKISVFSAEGENSKFISELSIKNNESESFLFKSFYIIGKKLTAVEEEKISVSKDIATTITRIETFDISNIKDIRSVGKYTQSGKYCSSKIIDGKLYLATVHHCSDENDLPKAAYGGKALSDSDVIATDNLYFTENTSEPNFMIISSVDTEGKSDTVNAKAMFGSSDEVYFSDDCLYITSYEFDDGLFNKQNTDKASYIHLPVRTTQLVKTELKDDISFASTAKISGYTDCQYSFDKKGDCLRVSSATTLDNDKFTESVNMFVLDKNLKCIGKITDYANNETVKAVRYIDDTAYVMTYKASDPLIIIDLKKNTEPKILGETRISGFSSTLVPVNDKTLLSVGYYTAKEDSKDSDGVKIVTFDVSNKTNPKKIDEKIFKNYESSAQYNANALLIDSKKGNYTIPMVYEHYSESDGKLERKFGALTFKVESGKINVVNDYTSQIFTASSDSQTSLDRCVSVGEYIYLLGSDYNYYKAEGNALIEAVVSSQ